MQWGLRNQQGLTQRYESQLQQQEWNPNMGLLICVSYIILLHQITFQKRSLWTKTTLLHHRRAIVSYRFKVNSYKNSAMKEMYVNCFQQYHLLQKNLHTCILPSKSQRYGYSLTLVHFANLSRYSLLLWTHTPLRICL